MRNTPLAELNRPTINTIKIVLIEGNIGEMDTFVTMYASDGNVTKLWLMISLVCK